MSTGTASESGVDGVNGWCVVLFAPVVVWYECVYSVCVRLRGSCLMLTLCGWICMFACLLVMPLCVCVCVCVSSEACVPHVLQV